MAQQNAGQIQVRKGTFSEDTCTTQNDLIANQAVKPAIRNMLEMKNKRYLMTLLTSGAVKKGAGGNSYFVDPSQRTKTGTLKPAQEDKGIGNNAYRFDIIGRIERASVIISQVGATNPDGSFVLKMYDQTLYPGHVVRFPSGKQARVQSYPTGSYSSGWLYTFKLLIAGTTFTFSTDVGSTKTCFPIYTAYSEGSLRSDSRDKKPDSFINHMTIQRKTCAITGGAQSDVLWYEYADGQKIGWLYWKLDQAKAVMTVENERNKWLGVSTMKNSDGTLRTESSLGTDPETGLPIIIGDGFEEQVAGTNTMTGSGVNGEATEDDFEDMMRTLQLGSNTVQGITWVCVTGTDGYANAQRKMQNLLGGQNIQLVQIVNQTEQAGGASVDAGFQYDSFNINGNKVLFMIHTLFDDPEIFPQRGNDGRLLQSSNYYFIGLTTEDKPTMEILCKEANGVKRDYVEAKMLGLTGESGLVQSEVDVTKYAMLKEDMFNIYNTAICGIIYKAA